MSIAPSAGHPSVAATIRYISAGFIGVASGRPLFDTQPASAKLALATTVSPLRITRMTQPSAADVVTFWREAGPGKWFTRDDGFDAAIRDRFEATHYAAARRELDGWADTPEGALALLLALDQFPRNLFRGSAHQFATDPLARSLAERAAARGDRSQLDVSLARFFTLPFQHSESLADQDRGVALCEALEAETGDGDPLKWARHHREIVARFDRFPHRNRLLGRDSTAEEQAWLDAGGFGG